MISIFSFGNKNSTKKTPQPSINVESACNNIRNHMYKKQHDIKLFNEQTGIMKEKSFYSKMYTLLEKNHTCQYEALQKLHGYSKNDYFYQNLYKLYQQQLNEWNSFIEILQNNYNSGAYKTTRYDNIGKSASILMDEEKLENCPEEFLDPISATVFVKPVITPSGITYEESVLLEHLDKNGNYDPVTRSPLKKSQLYPNLLIKDQITAYFK